MLDGRIGFKASIVNADEHKKIKIKLKDTKNGIHGYDQTVETFKKI